MGNRGRLVLGRITYNNFHSITVVILFLLTVFLVAALYPTYDSQCFFRIGRKNISTPSCDLFSGKWVYDNISYPLYDGKQCSLLEGAFACDKYGRKDSNYQKWRWQPRDCDLPRFNATALLDKLRGKKLIYVGDSLNRNQFNSMLCLIEPYISQSTTKSFIWKGNSVIFNVTDYNATIEFYWSPLLVESNCDDLVNHHVQAHIIRVNAIEKHATQWTDADILVFDSFTWWLEPKMTLLWGSFGSPDAVYREVETRHRLFEMALNTWADWMEFHINRNRTKLFFMSVSPFHPIGRDWGMDESRNCYNETEPILDQQYWGSTTDMEMMKIVESAIHNLKKKGLNIEYLNITEMSDHRKDAHPSIYRKYYAPLTQEQMANPESRSDCMHWCLPGVPDVWNVILYSYIMRS